MKVTAGLNSTEPPLRSGCKNVKLGSGSQIAMWAATGY